ncbi:MAG: hypothetical protein VKK59_03930 [Vampirovibrionales bacterium]|nr:hypothetical protein [Vampirovibrionales bacterium]
MPIEILVGNDAYRRHRALKTIRGQHLQDTAMGSLSHRVLEKPSLRDLDEVLNTPAMLFGGAMVIEVHYFKWLAEAVKTNSDEQQLLALIDTLTHLPEDRVLVMVSEKFDGKLKLPKAINALQKAGKARVQAFDIALPWKSDEALALLKPLLEADQLPISEAVAEAMIARLGHDTATLMSEAHKLVTYTGGKPVTLADLELLCGEHEHFEPIWIAWISGQWTTMALHSLKLALAHMNAAQIYSRAAGHLQEQYRLKFWHQMGLTQEVVATRLGKHPYRVKLALSSLQKIPLARLAALRAKTLELDWRFKSGQLSDALALDLLLAS